MVNFDTQLFWSNYFEWHSRKGDRKSRRLRSFFRQYHRMCDPIGSFRPSGKRFTRINNHYKKTEGEDDT